jgi:hypothetical protein
VAHALADLQDDPGKSSRWDLIAVDAARNLADHDLGEAGIQVPAAPFNVFVPSLPATQLTSKPLRRAVANHAAERPSGVRPWLVA